MPLNPSLIPHSSEQHTDREEALHGGGDALLTQLAVDDDSAAALPELESYINGSTQQPVSLIQALGGYPLRRTTGVILWR